METRGGPASYELNVAGYLLKPVTAGAGGPCCS